MARVIQLKTTGKTVWSKYAKGKRNFVWFCYANEFYRVACKSGSRIVQAFLLGHALELYFKAFLLSCGYGETKLRKQFGHNLKKLLGETVSNGLDAKIHISSQICADIGSLNSVYASKALEYFSILYLIVPPKLPEVKRLLRFIGVLKKFMETHIPKPTSQSLRC